MGSFARSEEETRRGERVHDPDDLRSRPSSGPPASVRLCDAACWAFAAWTLLCNVAVLLGGSLTQVMWSAGALAVVSAVGLVRARRRLASAPVGGQALEMEDERAAAPVEPRVDARRVALVVAPLVILAAFAATGSLRVLWWLLVAYLGCALVLHGREAAPTLPAASGRGLERALWALALVGVFVTLVSHRVGYDDTFYANLAANAADHPERPLLSEDTLHGIPGLPLYLPVYRVQSFELLVGAISRLSGIEPLAVSHLVTAPLAGALVVLAYARLFRLLLPGAWLAGVATIVALFLFVGETPHWYANLAFVRLQHGKGIFASVLLPLLIAYAIEYARAPSRRSWSRLAAAQIASIGLTASALWAAPTIVALGVLSAVPASRRGLVRLVAGVASSAYVLALALVVHAETARALPLLERGKAVGSLARYVSDVLGGGWVALAVLVSLLYAWQLAPRGTARRLCIAFPLAFLVVFLNPYWYRWLAAHVTGSVTYWRVFWILPVPLLLTLCLAAPSYVGGQGRRRARLAATALLVVGFVTLAPRAYTMTSANRVRLGWPGLKVTREYRVAEALAERVPPRSFVVAPLAVATWVPTLRDHPHPAIARPIYLRSHAGRVAQDEIRRRLLVTRYVDGQTSKAGERALRETVRDERVTGVCLRVGPSAERARRVLRDAGFRATYDDGEFEIWVREDAR